MKTKIDGVTLARRASEGGKVSDRQGMSVLRIKSPPKGPPLSFAVLLGRLSRGRLGPEAARDLLSIKADHISLNIKIDRKTGLVEHWSLRTENSSAPTIMSPADQMPPAA